MEIVIWSIQLVYMCGSECVRVRVLVHMWLLMAQRLGIGFVAEELLLSLIGVCK